MKCQVCGWYDHSGVYPVKCPNCDNYIGEREEKTVPAKPTTPIMYFFEVKDSTTVNAVIHVVKAQSEPDAKKGLLQYYRQKGITVYTEERISVSFIGTEEEAQRKARYSGYLVRKLNGDIEERPFKRKPSV